MTIKQQGGIFGRNPTFNEVEVSDLDATNQVHIGTSPFSDNEFVIRKTGSNPRAHISSGVSGTRVAELQMGTETRDWLVEAEGSPYNLTFNYIGTNAPTDNILKLAYGGDVTVGSGNLIIGTSGKGIDFSATSGTGTSELFSDYEEGDWTPEIDFGTSGDLSITYANQVGLYTKIGNLVTLFFNIDISSGNFTFSTSSGLFKIINFPFTSSNVTNARFGCGLTQYKGIDAVGSNYQLSFVPIQNSTISFLVASAPNQSPIFLDTTHFTSGSAIQITGSISYQV